MTKREYEAYLKTDRWKEISRMVKQRAGWKCQVCNSPLDLQAHHRTYDVLGDEEDHLDDLICLCDRCHKLFHGKVELKHEPVEKQPKLSRRERKRRNRASKMQREAAQHYNHAKDCPRDKIITLTEDLVSRLKTYKGGFTDATLKCFGMTNNTLVSGWRKRLVGKEVENELYYRALRGREIYSG